MTDYTSTILVSSPQGFEGDFVDALTCALEEAGELQTRIKNLSAVSVIIIRGVTLGEATLATLRTVFPNYVFEFDGEVHAAAGGMN